MCFWSVGGQICCFLVLDLPIIVFYYVPIGCSLNDISKESTTPTAGWRSHQQVVTLGQKMQISIPGIR